MTNDYMTGAELQALREACGLDRDQFGELCGVQGRSIKYWETGQTNHGVPADVQAMVLELSAKIDAEADAQLAQWKPGMILLRTGNAAANQVVSRIFNELRKRGQDVRIVAFDLKAFRTWIDATKGRDTPASRQQWAKLAVKQQAKPHRADQPV